MSDWTASLYTHVGQIRSTNEDSILDLGSQLLWAVADGMGGHSAGDYASQHVVGALARYQHHRWPGIAMANLQLLLSQSNRHLFDKADAENQGTIGCTVAALTFHGGAGYCSWSGDSRIYRVRRGKLKQLTRDHTHQSLFEDRNLLSQPLESSGDYDLLTAAIGGEETMHLEHCWFALEDTDQFLLCTDGLYKEVTDDELQAMLNTDADRDTVVDALSELYQARGARDNVGIIHVYLHQ